MKDIEQSENKDSKITSSEASIDQALDSIISDVPEDKREKAIRSLAYIKQEIFSGPIPHPDILRQYENILPGSADRILKMAENQQAHRINLESLAVPSQLKSNRRGQTFGAIICFAILIVSVVFAYFGMKTYAGILATIILFSVVALFINGKIAINRDLKEKDNKN